MLRLEYFVQTTAPVEVEGLLPSTVRGRSLAEIEHMEIFHGNRRVPLAKFFRISGDPGDGRLEFLGNLAGVHWLGTRLDAGEIHVAGNAGRHVGSQMTGGQIVIEGDAGDWLGCEMRGGHIHVRGQAADHVGAASHGSPRGMTGGAILIDGPAGDEIGRRMRRGLIAVGGAGEAAGFDMLAGTILVFGRCGIRPGANMRRGTIGLFGPERPTLLPTFRPGCRYQPGFLRMLAKELHRLGYRDADRLIAGDVELFHGDLVSLGRGEILLK